MVYRRAPSSKGSSGEEQIPTKRGLQSLARTVSPPPTFKANRASKDDSRRISKPHSAAVEAGTEYVRDHVQYWSSHLQASTLPDTGVAPRLTHEAWIKQYRKNAGSATGCHFVVTQHDHPIAGTHYDLRIQCNETSSISFAIMYGLPGDANSRRLNRNAVETRVHCLWNHLIETASHSTGSMLIWDTGEYEILPYRTKNVKSSRPNDSEPEIETEVKTEQTKLREAFQQRKVKLRLHGTRLPQNYTLALRLTKDNHRTDQPKKPARKRRRLGPSKTIPKTSQDTDQSGEDLPHSSRGGTKSPSPLPSAKSDATSDAADDAAMAGASDDEDETIRANNAYTGAINDIGSIHQRRWYLSIDRDRSGFVKRSKQSTSGFVDCQWECRSADDAISRGVLDAPTGFNKFIVGGRDTERSVVTGRLAAEVLADEGVVGYVPRGKWKAVTE